MKKPSKLFVSFLPALFAAFVFVGCVAEDLLCGTRAGYEPIPVLPIPVDEGERLVTDMVKTIRFYIFDDATEVLVQVIEVPEKDILSGAVYITGLPDGKYTLIAWGNSTADLLRSYMPVQMNNAATNDYESPKVGKTTLSNFFLTLVTEPLPGSVLGDVAPVYYDLDDLYYAKLTNVIVSSGHVSTSSPLNFKSNSNTLNLTLKGLENVPSLRKKRLPPLDGVTRAEDDPLDVFVLGKNGRYNADNEIDAYAQTVRYEPQYVNYNVEGETISVIVKTMRIDLARHTIDPMLLYIQDDSGDVIPPVDLVHAILQIEDENGEQVYKSQEAINRQTSFDIDVNFTAPLEGSTTIGVEITINGWEIVILYPQTGI